jgi:WD40 repeat protein
LGSFQAHSGMVYRIVNVDSFIWTSSNDNVTKIWFPSTKDSSKLWCVATIPLPSAGLHVMVASTDLESVWVTTGAPGTLYKLSITGKWLETYSTLHDDFVVGLCISPSPDRLWSCSLNGQVCYYETKRGQKTISRLQLIRQNSKLDVAPMQPVPVAPVLEVEGEENKHVIHEDVVIPNLPAQEEPEQPKPQTAWVVYRPPALERARTLGSVAKHLG